MVLPHLYTEWYWSGTLMDLQEYVTYAVRDTQYETRIIANRIDEIARKQFPAKF